MRIKPEIDAALARRMYRQIGRNAKSLRPFFAEAGEIIMTSVDRNFEEQGRPQRWVPSHRTKGGDGQTLSNTGRLRRSMTRKVGNEEVSIGTNVKYAAIHQFGGKIGPHIIRPRKAKALMFPGAAHPVKLVRHPGSIIPARPFLMVQDEDWRSISLAAIRHLEKLR